VKISFVRSVGLDSWSHSEVLAMLEGGNRQLKGFFERHGLVDELKYRTKAAMFYRDNLVGHVKRVAELGKYEGREVTRQTSCRRSSIEIEKSVKVRRKKPNGVRRSKSVDEECCLMK